MPHLFERMIGCKGGIASASSSASDSLKERKSTVMSISLLLFVSTFVN
jgi:hypothetical protein